MNREIQVLYAIFQLELSPPFKLIRDDDYPHADNIINKHSEIIGWTDIEDGEIYIYQEKTSSFLNKIKKTFNVDKLLDDDVYHITKHLINWLQDQISITINNSEVYNPYTERLVSYHKSKDLTHE